DQVAGRSWRVAGSIAVLFMRPAACGLRRDTQRRNGDACAVARIRPAVIRALDAALAHLSGGEAHVAMRASIAERGSVAALVAEQHHVLAEDRAVDGGGAERARFRGDVPVLAEAQRQLRFRHWTITVRYRPCSHPGRSSPRQRLWRFSRRSSTGGKTTEDRSAARSPSPSCSGSTT